MVVELGRRGDGVNASRRTGAGALSWGRSGARRKKGGGRPFARSFRHSLSFPQHEVAERHHATSTSTALAQ